ncbi:MAG TPA: c-type cytochrome, partial [Polyangiaceae bacterium]
HAKGGRVLREARERGARCQVRVRTTMLAVLAFLLLPGACARKPAPAVAKTPAAAKTPVAPPPLRYEVRLGKVTFTHYCQTCHGESGAGDGFNAFNLDPHPRDLSDPQFQKKKSDAELADAVQRGGAGVGLSALMPPWGHTLSARQIDELVLYLRTLPTPGKPAT